MKTVQKFKLKIVLIFALAAVILAMLGGVIGIHTANALRNVTVNGESMFYVSGSADVWAHRVAGETAEDESFYTMFAFAYDSDSVNYRRNLAYRWFYNAANDEGVEEGDRTARKAAGNFNLKIGFEGVDFTRFVITFESQQYTQTDDGKSQNFIAFVPSATENKIQVIITDNKKALDAPVTGETAENAEGGEEGEPLPAPAEQLLDPDYISIDFEYAGGGEYTVKVGNYDPETGAVKTETQAEGSFKNIGGTFAQQVNSSTKPVTPLSFKAFMPKTENSSATRAKMALYEMNGQSFLLSSTSSYPIETQQLGDYNYYTGGQVNDETPPVLCLGKGVPFIKSGNEISFDYTVIDVLAQSPSAETSYFILSNTQLDDTAFNPDKYLKEGLYRKVTDADNQYMIVHHGEHFLPADVNCGEAFGDGAQFGKNGLDPQGAVKVCVKITDTNSSGGQSAYVLLDWYADEEYLLTVTSNGMPYNYLAIADDDKGASYNYDPTAEYTDADENSYTGFEALVKEYQDKVTEAAKDLKAGSQNYFYLPSPEKLLSDNASAYEDMTYSIYYYNGSQQTDSSNAYNQLSFPLNAAGKYEFAIYAADAAGNDMRYTDADSGEEKTFTGSDMWTMYEDEDEEGFDRYLPWFTFTVEASEISVEDPGEQDTAYVGTQYTVDAFDVNGVSTKTEYTLYLFNNELYYDDPDGGNGKALTYEEFMAQKDDLIANHREWFTIIQDVTEAGEESDAYEKCAEYEWNASARTFIPRDENAFYLVECKVSSTEDNRTPVVKYMGIAASASPRPIAGEDNWFADNMTSVILLSIAGAALVGIVLLLVIRPKDKGDIDEVFEAEKNTKKAKKK